MRRSKHCGQYSAVSAHGSPVRCRGKRAREIDGEVRDFVRLYEALEERGLVLADDRRLQIFRRESLRLGNVVDGIGYAV